MTRVEGVLVVAGAPELEQVRDPLGESRSSVVCSPVNSGVMFSLFVMLTRVESLLLSIHGLTDTQF